MTKEQITEALTIVCSLDLDDDVFFEIKSVEPIRKDDVYGGYCVRLDAKYDTIITPLSIDISTGDIITPDAVKYELGIQYRNGYGRKNRNLLKTNHLISVLWQLQRCMVLAAWTLILLLV